MPTGRRIVEFNNITFKLKADGAKLTGTMGGDQFEQPIKNGEIHGDDIAVPCEEIPISYFGLMPSRECRLIMLESPTPGGYQY